LKQLRIILTGAITEDCNILVYGNLKSLDRSIFEDFAERGQVNCKAVTFTLESLVDADGGRTDDWTLENHLGNGVPYNLKIVHDKEGRQSERTYSSDTRFKAI
jgi:hypothetical protein